MTETTKTRLTGAGERTNTERIIDLSNIAFSWLKRGPVMLQIQSMHADRGERIFVHGPSGSGKTTLLSLLGGVVVPQSGEIRLLGQRLDQMRSAQRDRFRADHIGFIFQMFNLIPYLSIVDNVLLPCRFSAQRAQRAAGAHDAKPGTVSANAALVNEAQRLLVRLGLDESMFNRKATALSVGQQQRVAAARALIGDPALIIADEPTSALDANAREAFIELLFSQCHETQTTLLFVSHDQSLARLFDRQISMSDINQASETRPS